MKFIIILLLSIFTSNFSFSQTNKEFIESVWYADTVYRKVNYDGSIYLVRCRNSSSYSMPLVGRFKFDSTRNEWGEDFKGYQDMRHFFSKIDTILIKRDIPGVYVKSGCFEDVPEDWVKKALEN